MGEKVRFLIVEDEKIIALDIRNALQHLGHEVVGIVTTGEEVEAAARELRPEVALMDIELEGTMDGVEAAGLLRRNLGIPSLFITSTSSIEVVQSAQTTEPAGYILKPLNLRDFRIAVSMALYRVSLERELKKARLAAIDGRIKAEEALRAKSEFLAVMSHEIRTPLNSLLGLISLLESPQAPVREIIGDLRNVGESLLATINDILDFSKMEANRLEISPRPVDLAGLFQSVIQLIAPLARKKQLGLSWQPGPGLIAFAHLDPTRVKQILINLLANAVKFSDTGTLRLRVDSEKLPESPVTGGEATETHLLKLRVEDTGPGIGEPEQQHLFEVFSPTRLDIDRPKEGTGLGLSIARRLARLMGGDVVLTSSGPTGSIFTVTIPVRESSGIQESGAGRAVTGLPWTVSPLRILVAEDDGVSRHTLVKLLERQGHQVLAAVDGEQLLEKFRTEALDLIFTDVSMPKKDGLSAVAEIRKTGSGPNPAFLPVIALTGHAFAEDRARILAAGVDECLVKPIVAMDLTAMLSRFFPVQARRGAQPSAPPPASDASASMGPRPERRSRHFPTGTPPEFLEPFLQESELNGLFRYSFIEENFGDQVALWLEMVNWTIREMPARLQKIRDALARKEFSQVLHTAHMMKGAFANLGIIGIAEPAGRLENASRNGVYEEIEPVWRVFETVCELFARTAPAACERAERSLIAAAEPLEASGGVT